MASLTIRNLTDEVKAKLRLRAARHGRSMESEARAVLTAATEGSEGPSDEALDEIVAELQAALAPYKNPEVSLVDELIAERRLEAWKETLEELEWRQRHRASESASDG